MASKPDFEKFSLQELIEMKTALDDTIQKKREEAKTNLLKQFNELAEASGFNLTDLISPPKPATTQTRGHKPGDKRSTVEPKYKHPTDPSLVWTGRGLKPKWLRDLIDQGKNLDDFLIPKT